MSGPSLMRDHRAEMVELNGLSGQIVDACVEVHRELGPGWKEDHYEEALTLELASRGLRCERQRRISVSYKGVELRRSHRIDVIVEDRIIIEVKAVDQLIPIHRAQLLRYLRAAKRRLGILVNFDAEVMTSNIRRVVVDTEIPPVP